MKDPRGMLEIMDMLFFKPILYVFLIIGVVGLIAYFFQS